MTGLAEAVLESRPSRASEKSKRRLEPEEGCAWKTRRHSPRHIETVWLRLGGRGLPDITATVRHLASSGGTPISFP